MVNIDDLDKMEQLKEQIWNRLPDYEVLGMNEDDVDLRLLEDYDE